MFFNKQKLKQQVSFRELAPSSTLGRGLTSVKSAKDELFIEHRAFNPLKLINTREQFFGLELKSEQPFYLSFKDSTHILYCGPTRSAKGVAISHRIIEAIRQGKGVIIVDPKKDDYLPQVISEELVRQNRTYDLLIASWVDNFGYSGFDKNDTYLEFANKLIVALDLAPSGDPKSDFYRRNERTLLNKITYLFLNSSKLLHIDFEQNYKSLANFIKYLYRAPLKTTITAI